MSPRKPMRVSSVFIVAEGSLTSASDYEVELYKCSKTEGTERATNPSFFDVNLARPYSGRNDTLWEASSLLTAEGTGVSTRYALCTPDCAYLVQSITAMGYSVVTPAS